MFGQISSTLHPALVSTDGGSSREEISKSPLALHPFPATLARVRQGERSHLGARIVTPLAITAESASLSRRVLSLIPSIGERHKLVASLGCVSSGIGLLLSSAVTLGSGVAERSRSNRIGDAEGIRRASVQIASGFISANSSAMSLAEGAANAIPGFGAASLAFCVLGSVLNIGSSGLGLYRACQFRNRIDQSLNATWLSERERVLKTLEFLKEKSEPTQREIDRVVRSVERMNPKLEPAAKSKEIQRRILDLFEVKLRYVKRRCGQETAIRLLKEIDQHLEKMKDPKVDSTSLQAAKALIAEVKKQNKHKILLSLVVAFVSLFGLAAFIAGTVLSLGTLPFILYGISSALALALLLFPLVTDNLRKTKIEALESRAMALAPMTVLLS